MQKFLRFWQRRLLSAPESGERSEIVQHSPGRARKPEHYRTYYCIFVPQMMKASWYLEFEPNLLILTWTRLSNSLSQYVALVMATEARMSLFANKKRSTNVVINSNLQCLNYWLLLLFYYRIFILQLKYRTFHIAGRYNPRHRTNNPKYLMSRLQSNTGLLATLTWLLDSLRHVDNGRVPHRNTASSKLESCSWYPRRLGLGTLESRSWISMFWSSIWWHNTTDGYKTEK